MYARTMIILMKHKSSQDSRKTEQKKFFSMKVLRGI